MRVNQIRVFIFIFLFGLFFINFSQALLISEIQFDPVGTDTDREWIEIYNETGNSIDLTQIKFFEANVNHGIDIFNLANSTDKNVLAGEYVVIVQDINKFKLDFPTFSGKIFKSIFSLSNNGEALALKERDGNILFTINYTEADKQASPSPGVQNSGSTPISNTTSTTTNFTTTNSNTNTENNTSTSIDCFYKSYWPETEKIYAKIADRVGENMLVMQGQEIIFSPKVLDGYKKEIKSQNSSVLYKWSFGDGYTSDKREGLHSFKFTGEFVVNLQVNANGYIDEDKIYIKVVEPKVKVRIVEKDFTNLIEIKNENNFELNIGGLNLKNENNKNFILPEKLTILPNKAILLPPELTGFASSTSKVILRLGSGKVISEFQASPSAAPPLAPPQKGGGQVQVFTKDDFDKISKNIITATSSIKKVAFKKKIPPQPQPLATPTPIGGHESAKQNTNTNKIEFKNDDTILTKFKNFWSF